MKIAIIGIGRLGGALALALAKKGYEIQHLIARQKDKAREIAELIAPAPDVLSPDEIEKVSSQIIFIATPDPEIQAVAENLAEKLNHRPAVFHTSGALSSDVLQSLRRTGCPTASLHPLVSISDARLGAERFENAFFCLEGERAARELGEKIVADLGGNSFSVETKFKTLYHASAVIASGHLVALFSAAIEALAACGLSDREAQKILFPLVRSTVENLSAQTPARALTGTFARADAETLKRHLETLRENVPAEILAIYLQLGMHSLHLAEQQGASREKLDLMKKMLLTESVFSGERGVVSEKPV